MEYRITKKFHRGFLKGTEVTETTSVKFDVGFKNHKYEVVAVEEVCDCPMQWHYYHGARHVGEAA